jgi:hypothetical protein
MQGTSTNIVVASVYERLRWPSTQSLIIVFHGQQNLRNIHNRGASGGVFGCYPPLTSGLGASKYCRWSQRIRLAVTSLIFCLFNGSATSKRFEV